MKDRLLWTLILAVGGAALFFGIVRPEVSNIPAELRDTFDDLMPPPPPPLEPPALVVPEMPMPTLPPFRPPVRSDPVPARPEVPIQDNATIDFSTGAPVIRRHGEDQEALQNALKEMSEVVEGARIEAEKK